MIPNGTQLAINLNTSAFEFWMISVHEEGHFLPGLSRLFGNDFILEPRRIGQSKRSYMLELTQTTYLDKEETPCLPTEDIFLSFCIKDYIMRRLRER